jgi:predicted flap endonuclease-1-like 5' DNA nuclease
MSYLILQITLCLVASALLGLAAGWLFGRRSLGAALEEERNTRNEMIADWRNRHQEALDLADVGRQRIASLETDMDVVRGELQSRTERAIELEGRIDRSAVDVERLQEALSSRRAELEAVRGELAAAHEKVELAAANLSDKDDVITQLQKGLAERDKQIPALQNDLRLNAAELAEAQKAAAEAAGGLKGLESALKARDALISRLEDQLAARAARISELEAQSAEPLSAIEGRLANRGDSIAALEDQLAERSLAFADVSGQIPELKAQISARAKDLERCGSEREGLRAEVHRLETRLHQTVSARTPTPAPDPEATPQTMLFQQLSKDDLKKIWGIGPKLERLLNEMDVYYFRQIADWSDDEIEEIQAKLEEFPGRIRRDDWVTGAKREHKKKYGEEL